MVHISGALKHKTEVTCKAAWLTRVCLGGSVAAASPGLENSISVCNVEPLPSAPKLVTELLSVLGVDTHETQGR